jgi:hypothetical protein
MFESSPGKQFARPHLQNNHSRNGLEVWLKRQSTYCASMKTCAQTSVPPNRKS